MEGLFDIFRGEKKPLDGIKIYPAAEASRLAKRGIEAGIRLQNNIISIDFAQNDHFIDPNTALMCLEVLTSDGKIGSISHLQIDARVNEWADTLLGFHKVPCAVCLSGGEGDSGAALIDNVTHALKDRGFTFGDNDVGGKNIYRQATIFKDRVEVKHSPYIGPSKQLTLQFNIDQN